MKLMRNLNTGQGLTVIIVTHDPAVAQLTDRVISIRDGKIAR
jgi:putative ABC transport system ATP-binding protein